MNDEREWGTTPQRVGNDGLAAVAIALVAVALIAFVIVSLV
jgi:hypothetical protein